MGKPANYQPSVDHQIEVGMGIGERDVFKARSAYGGRIVQLNGSSDAVQQLRHDSPDHCDLDVDKRRNMTKIVTVSQLINLDSLRRSQKLYSHL